MHNRSVLCMNGQYNFFLYCIVLYNTILDKKVKTTISNELNSSRRVCRQTDDVGYIHTRRVVDSDSRACWRCNPVRH